MDSVLPKTKVCSGCGKRVKLSGFYKHWNGKFGRASQCIKCVSEYDKARYKAKKGMK